MSTGIRKNCTHSGHYNEMKREMDTLNQEMKQETDKHQKETVQGVNGAILDS